MANLKRDVTSTDNGWEERANRERATIRGLCSTGDAWGFGCRCTNCKRGFEICFHRANVLVREDPYGDVRRALRVNWDSESDNADELARRLVVLQTVEELDLHCMRVWKIGGLSACTSLRKLDLHGTQVGCVDSLATCSSLRHLDLFCTHVSNVAPLAHLMKQGLVVFTTSGRKDATSA